MQKFLPVIEIVFRKYMRMHIRIRFYLITLDSHTTRRICGVIRYADLLFWEFHGKVYLFAIHQAGIAR